MLQVKFTPEQAQWLAPVWDHWLRHYFQQRFGASWFWYWLNWQHNHEVLF